MGNRLLDENAPALVPVQAFGWSHGERNVESGVIHLPTVTQIECPSAGFSFRHFAFPP
jgi:hypothetical protein